MKRMRMGAIAALVLLMGASVYAAHPGEGLQVAVQSVEIGIDLKPVVTYTMTDDRGVPLPLAEIDRTSFILARLIVDQPENMLSHYESYTVRTQTTPDGSASAEQATYDSGSISTNEELGGGRFRYTFETALPPDFDTTATHTLSAQITRTVEENTYHANPVFHFVPNGDTVTHLREISTTDTCNDCHTSIGIHGGGRKELQLCNLCHSPQSIDPDTGNTVDMKVMVHKIHAGLEGYQIVGFRQSVHDYSHVEFPTDIMSCEKCHTGPQGDRWKTAPSRDACGSCHEDIDWVTGEGHHGGPASNDGTCGLCHQPEGTEFDNSVAGAHTIPSRSMSLRGLVTDIVSVENGAAGSAPTVRLTVTNGDDGSVVPFSGLSRLALTLAGPTQDYQTLIRETAAEDTLTVDGDTYVYTFAAPVPADAQGTFAVGVEARRSVAIGGDDDNTVNEAADNDVEYFSVDGGSVAERRQVVSIEKCNACHEKVSLHGSLRNQIEYCVMCHAPNGTDIARRPAEEMPPVTINMKDMIHKIHTGDELNSEYTVYGFGNTPHDFAHIEFPGQRQECSICHVNDSYELPLASGLQPTAVTQESTLISSTPPTAAACLTCHDNADAIAHAALNTTAGGAESCGICHGEGRSSAVSYVHRQKVFLAPQDPTVPPVTSIQEWMLSQ